MSSQIKKGMEKGREIRMERGRKMWEDRKSLAPAGHVTRLASMTVVVAPKRINNNKGSYHTHKIAILFHNLYVHSDCFFYVYLQVPLFRFEATTCFYFGRYKIEVEASIFSSLNFVLLRII
ncbi:hypothetical protein VPH35_085415 [Triticum aestivum]